MKKLILSLFSVLVFHFSAVIIEAQGIDWNYAPSKGFVYQINNKEAQRLLTGKYSDSTYLKLLYNLVDTFEVRKGWIDRPSQGHFILARIFENKLKCEYTSIIPYQVFLFKEYDAFALQVLDLDGKVREDAKVRLGYRRLYVDRESKTYRVNNEEFIGTNRFVTVELNGFRSVFDITKHDIPTWHDHDNYHQSPSYYSYIITDKNKYKPGDLIRYKSYALNSFKSPVRKELELWLIGLPRPKKIGTVHPHRPGSFAGEFRLNDSLNLKLDKNYTLQLRDKEGQILANCGFRYEDYELFGSKLEIHLENNKHFFPESNILTITATDVNGLLLKDAKASILIKTNSIIETYQSVAVLPDTLIFKQIDLDPGQPTQFEIPYSVFQKTNSSYTVKVVILNSENERVERNDLATYYYSNYNLTSYLSNDSICFDLLKNDEPMDHIPVTLRFNDDVDSQQVELPLKLKLNPALLYYNLKNDFISTKVILGYLKPELELFGGIQKDSFKISLKNTQRLDVSWFVYQGSKLLTKGFGKEIDYKSLIEDRTNTFYIELIYSLGGQEHMIQKQYTFKEDFLDVSIDIPERVYPGQQVDATIHVNDQLGNPVKGVDLTAWATTSKLNYNVPDLPYYGSSSLPRPKRAYYSMEDKDERNTTFNLDYKRWESMARLDTMKYYQFTYPQDSFFRYEVDIDDSTQFAPFVMKNGTAVEVYVVELDRRPVYYSWAEQPRGYSFYISPCRKHQITLRLADKILILDSMVFEPFKKTIISLDIDHLPAGATTLKLSKYFTDIEISRHRLYLARVYQKSITYGYFESKKEFIPLFNSENYGNLSGFYRIVGPVQEGRITYTEGTGYSIKYNHTGNYSYSYDDNVVYKMETKQLIPQLLSYSYFNPMQRVNDKVLTKKEFIKHKATKPATWNWHPRIVDIVGYNGSIKYFLPYEISASGIASFGFEDRATKNIIFPNSDTYLNNRSNIFEIPVGCYNAIVFYNNGNYLRIDSITFKNYSNIAIDLNKSTLHPADSFSISWILNRSWESRIYKEYNETPVIHDVQITQRNISTGNIIGTIYDQNNEPIPGACIIVKGTTQGTISDVDGHFSLLVNDDQVTLSISFLGYKKEEVEVSLGSEVTVHLTEDIMALEEVVVVGYGVMSKSELTGSVASISSERFIEPKEQFEESEDNQQESQESEKRLYQELLTLNNIRSDFSDVGFWEPRLFTDRRGESHFKITFPDDITRWNTVVYAMNRWLQTGTARKSIKSYKPLMAELHVPQFLTRGDSSMFIGKLLNYTTDSTIKGIVSWKGAPTEFEKNIQFNQYYTDKLMVVANTIDSITASYKFKRHDGYLDGEERTIPVVEQGIIRANGDLSIMKNGDVSQIAASGSKKTIVEILDNQIDIYNREIESLMHYRYDCNEQLASKLIGLLNYRTIKQYEGKTFLFDNNINRIIHKLLKNQNREFLWSWWDISPNTSYWISSHVIRALKCAKDAGYKVNLDLDNITRKAEYKFEFLNSVSIYDIDLMHALAIWGVNLNYAKYLGELDSAIIERELADDRAFKQNPNYYRYSYLTHKLLIQEIRQINGLSYQRDTLLKYRKEGIMGESYFTDGKMNPYWYYDDLASNVIAYRLIKRDSALSSLKVPVQLYFLTARKKQGWNTYQSSNIIMEVIPDLMADGFSKKKPTTVLVSGKENKTITEFPYHVELVKDEKLEVKKVSGLPVFLQQYEFERVTQAKAGVEGFEISSHFRGYPEQLVAGEPINLIVNVKVIKTSFVENVMIEIPIPAACSYNDKFQPYYRPEIHREYFKEKTVIFCESLREGEYEFIVHLLPRYSGKYILNPAQVSLMYVPVVNANTDMKKVEVVEAE